MPDQKYTQKGPTHGGDDDSSGSALPPEAPKKLDLHRYLNKPDVNPRTLFWELIKAYSEKQDIRDQLARLKYERMVLLRIALGIVQNPGLASTEMKPAAVAKYFVGMILDAGWEDVFVELIDKTYDRKTGVNTTFLLAISKACENPENMTKVSECLKKIILKNYGMESALAYVAEIQKKELTKALKKELMIVAMQDVDQTQQYAIYALSPLIDEDENIKKSFIGLVGDWDELTRKTVATVLKGIKDPKLLQVAERQLKEETNDQIKSLLKEIINNNNKTSEQAGNETNETKNGKLN